MNSTKKFPTGVFLLIILICILILLPVMFQNPSRIGVFIQCGVAAILAMGWLQIARIGCLSLGQAAFLAIGAYTSAIVTQKLGISPWFGLLCGGVASGLVAGGLGLVFLRVRGLSLTIITFAFAAIVRLLVSNIDFLGGHGGIMEIPLFNPITLPWLGEVRFDSSFSCYYILLAIFLISGFFMWRLDHSALGRTFRSLPQNENLAQSLGVYPFRYKIISFVTACFFAGVAGAFTAHYYTVVSPLSYTLMHSIFVQIQATVGGVASVVWGGFLGASVMVWFETWLLKVDPRWVLIFYGTVIIGISFFLPDGLLSLSQKVKKFLKGT